jgi:ATP-dependent DNA helicase HFM1/MER3
LRPYSTRTKLVSHWCLRDEALFSTFSHIASCFSDSFDDSYRPVPLTTHVIGQGYISNTGNQFRFWDGLERNVPELVIRFSQQRPAIVFCHSKKGTEKLADLLANANGICLRGNSNQDVAGQTKVTKLQRALYRGIAYHHAGLEAGDRRLVEKAFAGGKIRVLCATSTLAMGVNLPAHLVIIQGTMAWRGGGAGYQQIDQASLLQMIGRAGRPGFDTTGTAVIMTDNQSKATFQKLASSGLDTCKSKLILQLDMIINSEVSTGVITGLESAVNWLKDTLYFLQLAKNPSLHGVMVHSPQSLDAHLSRLCQDSLERLEKIGLLARGDAQSIRACPASHIMVCRPCYPQFSVATNQ